MSGLAHTQPTDCWNRQVSMEDVLQMHTLETHEDLKMKGVLVEFQKAMGKAIFVSHQWADKDHPDPSFEQFTVFQSAMRRILCDMSHLPLHYMTEVFVPGAKTLSTKELRSEPLFVWYDYFSCPQHAGQEQEAAITSIHAYVVYCSFFVALCPFIHDPTSGHVFDAASWRARGWCRLERTMRELSEGSWILVQSPKQIEVVLATESLMSGPTGHSKGKLLMLLINYC